MALEIILPVMTFVAVMALGGAVLSARTARQRRLQERLQSGLSLLNEPRRTGWLVGVLRRLGSITSLGKPSAGLSQELARAGYHGTSAPAIYMGAKVLLLLVVLALMAALISGTQLEPILKVMLIVGVPLLASFVPNLWVYSRRKARRKYIRQHLADAVDLLEICVSSGMGLDSAWNAVTDEIRRVCEPLADEMALGNLEMHLGVQRAAAMRHMSDRSGAEEFAGLSAMLVQSDRFGTSIADALRVHAESMREQRSQRAQEAAEKMAVKLILPMTMFIFPAVVIVMAGPAGMAIFQALNQN